MEKKHNVTIRLTSDEQVLLQRLAAYHGLSQATVVGQLLRREGRRLRREYLADKGIPSLMGDEHDG